MALIRAFLNNGFFVLVLIVAVTLYLAYSDSVKRDHGLLDKPTNHVETDTQQTASEVVASIEVEASEPAIVEVTPAAEDTPQVVEPTIEVTEKATAEETPVEAVTTTVEPAVEAVENVAETVSEAVVETATAIATVVAPLVSEKTTEKMPTVVAETQTEPAVPTQIKTKQATFQFPTYDETNLQAILDDKTLTEGVPEFASTEEAYAAARQAFYDQDYLTSEKIYFSMARKNPTANAVGELGNVLFIDGKKEWANRAWLESAKLLIQENRVKDAYTLANRLHPVAPETARKIGYQLSKMMAAKHSQNLAEKQVQPRSNFMPPMQNMKPMAQPQFKSQPMPPMQNRQMDPRMIEMQKAQEERRRAFMEQMSQQQMQPPAQMPAPQFKPAPSSQMPPMQNMKPMAPITQPQFQPQSMPPMQHMQMDPRMIEMQKAQEERRKAFMEQMSQQQMQPPAQIPAPQFKPAPSSQMPPMQNMKPMAPITQPQFQPQSMPPMQNRQMDPRMVEMQKAQEERRRAFMEQMRQQQMQPPAQVPAPQFKPMPYDQMPPMTQP
ncbi:MAG: hypothetical protein U9R28_06270 [Pseudomonadota bacterium]|nr:hypothetical protein [Pseudomonadota bacterium]